MKGVILAGGTGSRLYPLTKVTNKHLLPVYNKPMIFYPLFSLKQAGITDILIVSGRGHSGAFLELLGSGAEFGLKLSYEVQEEAGGIAQALSLAKNFIGNSKFVVILGDNIIEDNLSGMVEKFSSQKVGAKILLKSVKNPSSYGVADIKDGKILSIEEKPASPKSDLAVIGYYMYDQNVFDVIDTLKPSHRGELEITDVNKHYLEKGTLEYDILKGFWGDCGESFESLMDASSMVKNSYLAGLSDTLDVLPLRQTRGLKQDSKKVRLVA